MKNNLSDLNNILFEQLERLNDDDLHGEQLEEQIKKSKAMSNISTNIISNSKLMMEAQKHYDNMGFDVNISRPLLGEEVSNELYPRTNRVSKKKSS